MREQVLRQFFEGTSSGSELAKDVAGAAKQASSKVTIISIEDMDDDFAIGAAMAVRLCDAVLSGEIPADALKTIGFALIASDKFHWDADEDDVLASVLADWSCPEINYPLTVENVRRFRAWLTRAEGYPPKPASGRASGDLISVTEKKNVRPLWKRLGRQHMERR